MESEFIKYFTNLQAEVKESTAQTHLQSKETAKMSVEMSHLSEMLKQVLLQIQSKDNVIRDLNISLVKRDELVFNRFVDNEKEIAKTNSKVDAIEADNRKNWKVLMGFVTLASGTAVTVISAIIKGWLNI